MLRLLCRAHELEVENTELQASSLRRANLLCQKDVVIQRLQQHRLLSERVIRGQQRLLQGEARPSPCPSPRPRNAPRPRPAPRSSALGGALLGSARRDTQPAASASPTAPRHRHTPRGPCEPVS